MKSYNLQFYVDKLKNKEHFSLSRYGDGELYCMWGKMGQNSNGCKYSYELRQALLQSMNVDGIMYGLQRVLPKDQERVEREYPNIDWHDTEIFSEAVAEGKLYPLIEQLAKMKVCIIGNSSIIPIADFLPYRTFIEVPPSNAYDNRKFVLDEIRKCKDDVYLFSCGMAANAFIAELHGEKKWLIDLGHIWDPFVGNMSRCDLEGKTKEDIDKNLHD